jgi:hypothetical protein
MKTIDSLHLVHIPVVIPLELTVKKTLLPQFPHIVNAILPPYLITINK